MSSTYYDLKHVRASLDLFVQGLGFESILSEKGNIAYSSERPLDESCYAEVSTADMFVLLLGGRYGSAASDQPLVDSALFYERYDSITRREYERAVELDIPVYILVDKAVHAEYQTYLHNRDVEISYAHVDSVNVFKLLEDILSQPRNNPLSTFERFSDIEAWLREQWSGLFRDLLRRSAQQSQLKELNEQISAMREINVTLKTYLETVVRTVAPDRSEPLIEAEDERISRASLLRFAKSNGAVRFLSAQFGISTEQAADCVVGARSTRDLLRRVRAIASPESPFMAESGRRESTRSLVEREHSPLIADADDLRAEFSIKPLNPDWTPESAEERRSDRPRARRRGPESDSELPDPPQEIE